MGKPSRLRDYIREDTGYRTINTEHRESKTMTNLTYPAAIQALYAGENYAQYIQENIAGHVAKGHYSQEWAMSATLGDLLSGNDGE